METLICAGTAIVVWGLAIFLASKVERNLSPEDREAEAKGYLRKFDTPRVPPNQPKSGSDPPPAA